MAQKNLDRVYGIGDAPDAQRTFYNQWADTYDAELVQDGYATPKRVADALAALEPDRDAPILDFGCGTGLSGEALAGAGFTTLDGCEISESMLAKARFKGVYRRLWLMTAGVLDIDVGAYATIAACGVISPGAAPASALDLIADKVGPGGKLIFSFNEHALESAAYMGSFDGLLRRDFIERSRERGPHIAGLSSVSTVFVLQRRQ